MWIKKIGCAVAFASTAIVGNIGGDNLFSQACIGSLNRMPDEFLALPALRIQTASLVDVNFRPFMQSVISVGSDEQFPDQELIVDFSYAEVDRSMVVEKLDYPSPVLQVMSDFLIAQKSSYVVMSNTINVYTSQIKS